MALDLNGLLAPISPEQPTGQWLRASDDGKLLWTAIKDGRQTARDAEQQLLRPPSQDAAQSKPEDLPGKIEKGWRTVLTQSEQALTRRTKDLQVAAWLTEGAYRYYGLEGLKDGLTLCRELCERYWEGLYPPVDELDVEEGIHTTVTQLAGLAIALESPLNNMTITESGRKIVDFLKAKHLETVEDAVRQKEIAEGVATVEVLAAEGGKTPPEVHTRRIEMIEGCLEETGRLKSILADKCVVSKPNGEQVWLVPNLAPLSELLERVRDALATVRGSALTAPAAEGQAVATGGQPAAGGGPVAFGAPDLRSREAAYVQILQIADFLEKAEPHSPVPHVLRQAVKFGRMSLPDLLVELLGRSDALNSVVLRTGVKIPEQTS